MSSGRRPRKTEAPGGAGAPAWMTTFSDMMSLLLTFFILLYSMSNIDARKFQALSESLSSVLSGQGSKSLIENPGPSEGPPLPAPDNEDPDVDEEVEGEELEVSEKTKEMYENIKAYVEEEELDTKVAVRFSRNGVFVNIREMILFEPGESELKEGGKEVLAGLESLLLQFENEIVVEGHTDNIPQRSTKYATNWELSTGRATAVVRYLSEVKNIPGRRLAAIGYGEHRPIRDNTTPGNRAQNRRVNLLIIMEEEGEE